jgi:crossover junction endodeoxyribonuclease RuvC
VRVFGIDCGSARTGYGIVDSDGGRHRMVAAGAICTNTRLPFELRLLKIATELRALVAEHAPDGAAVEGVFLSANARTALKLAQVRGVALLVVAEAGVPLAEYSPLEVKTSVVGYGRAEKAQVQAMVQSLLKLKNPIESEDAADALAVAICHATHEATRARIGRA